MHSTLEVIESTDGFVFDLVDLATLKSALNIIGSGEDAALSASITRWSKIIAEEISRVLAFQDVRETFYFDRGYRRGRYHYNDDVAIRLGRAPVELLSSPTVDSNEVDASDYDVDNENGSIWIRNHSWWMCRVVVVYTAGFDLPTAAPASLQQACIHAVRDGRIWTENSSTAQAVQRVAHGDEDIRYFEPSSQSGLSSSVLDLIQPFRRLLL